MKPHLSDSHAHLTSSTVYNDVDAILSRAQAAGVGTIVNICTNAETLERGLILREKYPWVYLTAATTPHDVEKEGESFFPLVEEQAQKGALVAIGETGLDYYYEHAPRDLQKHFLKRYFKLALECKLPIVIHCREAFADLFELIDSDYAGAPGILHCFTGNLDEAKEVIKRGWYLSLSGIVTFKKSDTLREVATWVPLEKLLIETDTPYLAPQSHRGKTNEPAYILETAEMIASLKGVTADTLIEATTENCATIFNLK